MQQLIMHRALVAGRRDADLKEVVNRSITQTLSRSINTSLTTFIMVFVLFNDVRFLM